MCKCFDRKWVTYCTATVHYSRNGSYYTTLTVLQNNSIITDRIIILLVYITDLKYKTKSELFMSAL